MPKRIPEEDLEAILGVVEHHPGGASRMAIAETLTPKLASRTLQFRLKYLVDAGRLVKQGEGRAAKYCLPETQQGQVADSPAARARAEEAIVPLSTASGKRHLTTVWT